MCAYGPRNGRTRLNKPIINDYSPKACARKPFPGEACSLFRIHSPSSRTIAYNFSRYQLIACVHKPHRMNEWNCSVLCEGLTPGFCLMHITILQPLTTTTSTTTTRSAHHINLVYFGLNRLRCNLDVRARRARVYPFVRFLKCVAFGHRSIATETMTIIIGRISYRPQAHTAQP